MMGLLLWLEGDRGVVFLPVLLVWLGLVRGYSLAKNSCRFCSV